MATVTEELRTELIELDRLIRTNRAQMGSLELADELLKRTNNALALVVVSTTSLADSLDK